VSPFPSRAKKLEITPLTELNTAACLLLNAGSNYVYILYRFRDTVVYLLKVADFNQPLLHLVLPLGMTPAELRTRRSLPSEN